MASFPPSFVWSESGKNAHDVTFFVGRRYILIILYFHSFILKKCSAGTIRPIFSSILLHG